MKRLKLLFVLGTLLGLLILPSLAQVGTVTTVTRDLTLRVGPGVEWRRLKVMPTGTNVAVDGRDVTGSWVRGIDQTGDAGWMAARFLSIGTDGAFNLPVIDREAPLSVGAPPPGAVSVAVVVDDTEDTSAPAPVAAPTGGSATTTASTTLNIRSGPSTDYRILGKLAAGEQFSVDGRDGTIGWVRGVNSAGIVGWVSVTYTGLTYDQTAALPVVDINTPFGLAVPNAPVADTPADGTATNVQPIASTAPVTGFAVGGQVQGFGGNAENAMRSAGMTWVKRQVVYDRGANPQSFAGWINDAHARGFRILLSVKGHPRDLSDPNFYGEYAGFVGGLAGLGADAIEVWNEMNIDREWPAGQINPSAYVNNMLIPAYNSIKATNPNTLVVSGAPAPTGFFGGCGGNGCDDAPYIAGMAAAGAANYMDCVGIHYNEGIVPPSQRSGDPRSEHYSRYFWGMVDAYRASFSKPLCFTEIGYLSPEGYGPLPGGFAWAGDTSVAEHAAWLGQARDLAASSGVVRLFIVWNVDFTQYGSDPQGGYAIIRPGGGCPACAELAN